MDMDFEGYQEPPDKKPAFAFPLRDRFLQEGVGFKLLASVEAKPPPTVEKINLFFGMDDAFDSMDIWSGLIDQKISSQSLIDFTFVWNIISTLYFINRLNVRASNTWVINSIQISWFKDGKPLKLGGRYDLVYSLGICSLEMGSCDPSDAGRYSCVAENAVGSVETSCKVTVNGSYPINFRHANSLQNTHVLNNKFIIMFIWRDSHDLAF